MSKLTILRLRRIYKRSSLWDFFEWMLIITATIRIVPTGLCLHKFRRNELMVIVVERKIPLIIY